MGFQSYGTASPRIGKTIKAKPIAAAKPASGVVKAPRPPGLINKR